MAMAVQRLSEQLVEMQYLSVDKRLARRIIHLTLKSSF